MIGLGLFLMAFLGAAPSIAAGRNFAETDYVPTCAL